MSEQVQAFPQTAAGCGSHRTGGNSAFVTYYFQQWMNPHLVPQAVFVAAGRCVWS